MKKLVVFLLGLLLITPAFASWQDETVKMSYPYNKEEARKVMMGKFPSMSDKTAEDWLESGKLDSVVIDFETRYFEDFIDTMEHIDLSLLHQDKELMARYRELYLPLKKLIEKKTAASPCQPFVNPVEYTGKASAAIPRDKLPKDGYYQVWIPT
ncbi:MAG: hypothetical protein KKH83_08555, partial [Candidatus Margulisbacteria bacterium]|nr:hypothetical protein [Candidatus Margulisiibacteriota bacterium]